MTTIIATAPPTLDAIKPGEVYETRVFTRAQQNILRPRWIIQAGTIKDPGPHYNVHVLHFVRLREKRPTA